MERQAFSEAEIVFLRGCVFDPTANYGCEMTSGAIHWCDEKFLEFVILSHYRGQNNAKQLFAYRTSLLVGKPREEFRNAWDALKLACSEWIGFRPERVTPAPHWPKFVDDALESY
jgi:hypothetical protein